MRPTLSRAPPARYRSAMSVRGKVRGLSNRYEDGVERQEIHFMKADASGLPYVLGSRVPIRLTIGGETFEAGLRATDRCGYVWISPDLIRGGDRFRLVDVLANTAFAKNEEVVVHVRDDLLTLEKVLG